MARLWFNERMPPTNQNPFVLPPKPERPRPSQPQETIVVQPTEPQQPAEIPPTGPNSPDYNFIMEPPKPPRRGPSLPGFGSGSSLIVKIGVVLGGLLVLIVIFSIAKNLLAGPGNTPALTSVVQSQQDMIHILTNGAGSQNQQQAVLSDSTQNFASTASLSLTSAQQQLLTYMANNGKKVNAKKVTASIDTSTDQQLAAAAANSTYETTFKQVMQTELTNYEKALQAAYKQTTGPRGRKLLSDEFNGAQLLLTQLNTPSSSN
jgi:hypothetical protein